MRRRHKNNSQKMPRGDMLQRKRKRSRNKSQKTFMAMVWRTSSGTATLAPQM